MERHNLTADQLGFLTKARESLAAAEGAFRAGWYSACTRDAYFAAYQGAIAALMSEGFVDIHGEWSHAFVQTTFVEQLVNRRRRYPSALRSVLSDNMILRLRADYTPTPIGRREADRAVRGTRELVTLIVEQLASTK